MADKLWKTTIVVEVLTMGENPPDYDTLDDVQDDATFGDASMSRKEDVHVELTKEQFITECDNQGSDPSFFFGDTEDEDTDASS